MFSRLRSLPDETQRAGFFLPFAFSTLCKILQRYHVVRCLCVYRTNSCLSEAHKDSYFGLVILLSCATSAWQRESSQLMLLAQMTFRISHCMWSFTMK